MSVNLYKVEECTFTLAGKSYPVSNFVLDIGENGIPVLTIGAGIGDKPVSPFDIGTYLSWYKDAQRLCDTRNSETSFTFKLVNKDTKQDVQDLKIENWICVQPGFNKATAAASMLSAGISLYHPVIELDCASTHLFVPDMYVADPKVLVSALKGNENIFSTFVECLNYYADYTPSEGKVEGESKGIGALHARFKYMLKTIQDRLTWDYTYQGYAITYPCNGEGAPDELKLNIKLAMFNYASQMSAQNPWSMIKQICSELCLTIIPNAHLEMTVVPYSPWAVPDYTISVEDVFSVSLPSQPVSPVLGAYISKDAREYTNTETAGASGDGIITTVPDVSKDAYVGWLGGYTELTQSSPLGCYKRIGIPDWFDSAIKQFIPDSTNKGGTEESGSQNTMRSGQDAGGGLAALNFEAAKYIPKLREEVISPHLQNIVDQAALTYYRATNTVAMSCRLLIKDNSGNMILPGRVIKVVDEDDELFSFYITNVTHSVDINSKQVVTSISGRYLRTQNDDILGFKSKNPLNPLYGGGGTK